jgi:hypothetical protein
MNKLVLVKRYFAAVGREITIEVPTGETKKGLFGGEKEVTRKEKQWEQTGFSDCKIDNERLATDLEKVINSLNKDGYKIQSVTPIMSGEYDYQAEGISSSVRIMRETESVSGGASYGYGYSYTDSLIVIAERNV